MSRGTHPNGIVRVGVALGVCLLAGRAEAAWPAPATHVRAEKPPGGVAHFPADPALDALLQTALARAYQQLAVDPPNYPIYTDSNGLWIVNDTWYWTSGFFPGSLWLAYTLSGDPVWLPRAESWTAGLADEQYNTTTHDVGFMIGRSYLNGFRLTGRADYRNVILTAAGSVAQRFNPIVGCIRALGDKDATTGEFLTGLDTMANVDLLLIASRLGGQGAWRDMAVSQALRTAEELIRPDGGTIHVMYLDTATGEVLRKGTLQGYSDDSTWTRGQAWVVYGYAMVYRETGDRRFLDIARTLADYYLRRLPAGVVPPWDFDDPQPNPPPDSSSTAIAASGLLDLSRLVDDPAERQRYWDAGCAALAALCDPMYLSDGTNSQAILLHATYNLPAGTGIDCSVVWGDYYCLHAIEQYYWLSTPVGGTRTSTGIWQNIPFPLRHGAFEVTFDAVAGAAGVDAVVAMSAGPHTAYPNGGVLVRFNPAGRIDVRNGGGYQADAVVPYTAGQWYHFRLAVDVPARRYSVFVRPRGGVEVRLAHNYGFRTEQAGCTHLDNWSLIGQPGALQVSYFRLAGDTTGDGKVNVFDLQRMARSWNKQEGQAGYDPACDLTGDAKVNVLDLQVMAVWWNK